jgi:hypothetical protein
VCLGAVAAAAAARAATRKMTQKEAGYVDEAEDGLICAACSLFEEPKYCAIVEGEVSPNGTCKYFTHVE